MTALSDSLDLEVFRRYAGLSLPRHVSYPMPTGWKDLDATQAQDMWSDSNACDPGHGLSLYIHIPFCEALCRYCACTRTIMNRDARNTPQRVDAYLEALRHEISTMAQRVGPGRVVRHIHWGGGSPTFLDQEAIASVHHLVTEAFDVADNAEIAMEVDPRTAPASKLSALRSMGFNRISLGVQDFNEKVQEHVRRVQSLDLVRATLDTCRELGFDSVNFDLIYGLPYQTVDTIRRTLEQTIELSPDRVAYYHYAQIPEKIATQRGLDCAALPDSETKLEMFLIGEELFTAAGYEFIGLDHFAKPEEGLARALRERTIQRNFQGMTTGGGLDLMGLGASSISQLADVGFLQNVHGVKDFAERMEADQPATVRGLRLSEDDRIRQAVIGDLYCLAEIQPKRIEERFGIVFAEYFAPQLLIMKELVTDGLATIDADGAIRATMPLGRVLMRTIAAAFDAYLEPDAYRVGDRRCFSTNA